MNATIRSLRDVTIDASLLAIVAGAALALAGCDRKEKVIEVNTPRSNVDVERDKDTGQVTVEVNK